MARKTIEVDTVISYINGALSAPSQTEEGARALNMVASHILHETDRYEGFSYVVAGGDPAATADIVDGNYDEWRRRYYIRQS